MSDREDDFISPREARIAEALNRLGLSYPEFGVMLAIHYDSHPPDRLARIASYESWGPFKSTETQCEAALRTLVRKRFITKIDAAMIREICGSLRRDDAYGPACGLPDDGHFDMTPDGGKIWEDVSESLRYRESEVGFIELCWPCDFHENVVLFADDEEFARNELNRMSSSRTVLLADGPRSIGRWRDRWWRPIRPNGYRLDVILVRDDAE